MRALVQRVTQAEVAVADQVVAGIGRGLLILVGVTHEDTVETAQALATKVHGLRVLRSEISLADQAGAAALVVSQFTLYGDARRGRRPTWIAAARGEHAAPLVEAFVATLRARGTAVGTGVFGADMQVSSVNDGPLTLMLEM